jgi:hypothetical protein
MSNDVGALLTQGGVGPSGEQTVLGEYNMGEGEVANAGKFAGGMGHSTNVTQADTGPRAGFALTGGTQSLADTAAMRNFYNTQFKNFSGGLGNILGKIASGV